MSSVNWTFCCLTILSSSLACDIVYSRKKAIAHQVTAPPLQIKKRKKKKNVAMLDMNNVWLWNIKLNVLVKCPADTNYDFYLSVCVWWSVTASSPVWSWLKTFVSSHPSGFSPVSLVHDSSLKASENQLKCPRKGHKQDENPHPQVLPP